MGVPPGQMGNTVDTRGPAAGTTVPVTVTYLEMTSPDQRSPARGVMEPTAIHRAERPTISFYRYPLPYRRRRLELVHAPPPLR